MEVTREAGILLPIFSLPSKYGIGNFGHEAFRFVDFLAASGQSLWQILPMGPTTEHNSPYQSLSAFAGSPWFIDPDGLAADGLLTTKELRAHDAELSRFSCRPDRVNYKGLKACREKLLDRAAGRFPEGDEGFARFCLDNREWLDDYADFLGDGRQRIIQYLFFRQWMKLKRYANARGIGIIGDMPLYVSHESCDFAANPKLFQGGIAVSGVPPDDFSEDGQVWDTPLYDWDENRRTGYRWWLARIRQASRLYDHLRIDHFRGLASYFSVPVGQPASAGHWEEGPGRRFVDAVRKAAPGLDFIAEDLGFLTDDVVALRDYSGWRGMKLLQSAFSLDTDSEYLPHNHSPGCVVYTGTHDNRTLKGWAYGEDPKQVAKAMDYLGVTSRSKLPMAMVRAALSSVAGAAVIPLQDWLGMGDSARINVPGTVSGRNWNWRLAAERLTGTLASGILSLTLAYYRGHNI